MSESIKQRLGGSHIGKESDKQLRKLFLAIQSDVANLNTQVANIISGVGNIRATVNNLVTDVQKISNNTNSANNTVQVTGTAVTTNLNNLTGLNIAV